jgi:hypothetical protein
MATGLASGGEADVDFRNSRVWRIDARTSLWVGYWRPVKRANPFEVASLGVNAHARFLAIARPRSGSTAHIRNDNVKGKTRLKAVGPEEGLSTKEQLRVRHKLGSDTRRTRPCATSFHEHNLVALLQGWEKPGTTLIALLSWKLTQSLAPC